MIEEKEIYILAKKFFEEEYGNERTRIHSACVIDLAVKAAPFFDLDEEVFIIAGWIHDMGRKIDADTHPEKSIAFLDKFLEANPEYKAKRELISDCILHHGRRKLPTTKYGKIMQLCDAASLKHQTYKDYLKKVGKINKKGKN